MSPDAAPQASIVPALLQEIAALVDEHGQDQDDLSREITRVSPRYGEISISRRNGGFMFIVTLDQNEAREKSPLYVFMKSGKLLPTRPEDERHRFENPPTLAEVVEELKTLVP